MVHPSKLAATLTVDGKTSVPVEFSVGSGTGDTMVISLRSDQAVQTTGIYDWSMDIAATFEIDGEELQTTQTISGRVPVVVRSDSMFGAGWNGAGVERLTSSNGALLYEYEDGSARIFDPSGNPGEYSSPDDFGIISYSPQTGTYAYTGQDGTTRVFSTASGYLQTVSDRHGQTITYNYDTSGRLNNVTDPDGRVATFTYLPGSARVHTIEQVGGRITTLNYDNDGRLLTMQLPDAGTKTFNYDTAGRLAGDQWGSDSATYTYDDRTGALRNIDRGGGTSASYHASQEAGFGYAGGTNQVASLSDVSGSSLDPLGQTTRQTFELANGQAAGLTQVEPGNLVSHWDYDNEGRTIGFTDPLSQTTNYSYVPGTSLVDHLSRSDGSSVQFTYDPWKFNQVTQVTDGLNHTTSITLNSQGDPLTITDPELHTTTFDYQNGLLLSKTDALLHTTTYEYDSNHRLTKTTDPAGSVTLYGYDDAWNNTSITDPLNHVTTFKYDKMRRLVETVDAESATTTYDYGNGAHRVSMTDPLGRRTDYGYDSLGRGYLISVTEAANKTSPRTTLFGYDASGHVFAASVCLVRRLSSS
ncbi:MAG: hypothetical protein ACJ8C4_06680 [Gemmataceae bacterium]